MKLTSNEFQVSLYEGTSRERTKVEGELVENGVALPLRARTVWAAAFPAIRSTLLVVRDATGARGAIALERHPSRALPGHEILRAWHVGSALPEGTAPVAIAAFSELVRRRWRALRAHLELYSRDPSVRERLALLLAENGFDRLAEPTNFGTSLLADLTGRDDASHFASLSQGVRQNIRAIAKFPVEMRRIAEVELSARMNDLLRETLSRTGATHQDRDFAPIIQLSLAHPQLSNLSGLYRTDISGPDSLIAFAWGVNQGDSVAYDVGASTRVAEFRNLSLGYPLVWELMVWGRSVGASFFDFGGITAGGSESEDRLGRISDFKRRFSKEVVQVAEEWVYAPHKLRNLVADSVSRAARLVHR